MSADAAQIFAAGYLQTIVGVWSGTSCKDLKEACKRTRLRTHPDKGGNGELFIIVEEAAQLLLNVPPDFVGIPPIRFRALCLEVVHRRSVFDRGLGGDVRQLQRLRVNDFSEHQEYLHELQEKTAIEELIAFVHNCFQENARRWLYEKALFKEAIN